MKKLITCIVATALLFACASETEKGVLEDIAEVYGGETSYSKSFVSNTSEKRTTFNVTIKNSQMIDTLAPTVTTANASLMVYDALTSEEKKNYTDIETILVNAKNDTISYYYPMSALAPISKKAKVFHTFSSILVDGNFDQLNELDRADDIPANFSEILKNGVAQFEKKYGSLKEYQTFGVAEERDNVGTYYQFQAHLIFANGHKMGYWAVVDAAPDNDALLGYKFFQ
jgi:hypothetical protein|tara:strand:+ start:20399 stop:21082 length:684 start_codon:yes stop_codon:yes gene_type:complete